MSPQSPDQTHIHPVNQITSFSKYLALVLFIILPFIGAFVGYQYAKSQSGVTLQVLDSGIPSVPQSAHSEFSDIVISDTTDFYYINAVYPVIKNDREDVVKKYVTGLVAEKQTEWKKGGEAYTAEMDVARDFPDRPKVQYALDIRYSSSTVEALKTTSYVFLVSEMTGGANGNAVVTSFTFDDAGQVAIEEILNFDSSNDIALTRLLKTAAISQYGSLYMSDPMLSEGLGLAFLKPDGVTFDSVKCACDGFLFASNFQTFSLSDIGITFSFSKYAIAPGVVMTPEITLTWSELKPYLTPAYKNKTATLPAVLESFSTDDKSILFYNLENQRYQLVTDGVVTTGAVNYERGYKEDPDATVYVLDYDKSESEQIYFVRLSKSTDTIQQLTSNRDLVTTTPILSRIK